jgi:tRNA(Ile)-lysidine synthase
MSAGRSLVHVVAGALAPIAPPGSTVCCGLSGGRDSTLLLALLHEISLPLGLRLSALHVHHGLSPDADAWERRCHDLCHRLGVPLDVRRVHVEHRAGPGLEAAARTARYRCYRESAAQVVALAHHADDQAETVLLQLLRGAGPAGLAAMPAARSLGEGAPLLVRPLLDVSRSNIEAELRRRTLRWVEDESNADTTRARNYLRHEVMPRFEALQPGLREALARSARNAADAAALAETLAAQDLAAVSDGEGLEAGRLRALEPVRAANLVRHWLARHGVDAPPRERLLEGLHQLLHARADAAPRLELGERALARHRDRLLLAAVREPVAWSVPWCGQDELALPDGRLLRFEPRDGAGISRARVAGTDLVASLRRGGERLRPGPGRPHRTLKNLLREASVPAWERLHIVVLRAGGATAWAQGIGADADFAAAPDEPGIEPVVIRPAPGARR